MSKVREYNFASGPTSEVLPTASTPSAATDLITLSYLQDSLIGVTGSWASPQSIVAGTGIAYVDGPSIQTWFIEGSGGAINITANPQIVAGTVVGKTLTLICVNGTNTVTIDHSDGLTTNGSMIMGEGEAITFTWGGATPGWIETSRSK